MPGMNVRLAALALIAVALPLAGCGTTGDMFASMAASPGQYDYYDCPAIKVAAKGIVTRQRKLEALMARAGRGPAGGLVNATTYEPEYVTLRGKMNLLHSAALEKHCNFDPRMVEPSSPKPAVQLPPPPQRSARKSKRR